MEITQALDILKNTGGSVELRGFLGHKFYEAVENAFLRNRYTDNYLICKNIIKKEKNKDGEILRERSYIFYYIKRPRESVSREERKAKGEIINNYTTDKYLGGVESFVRQYESYMQPLLQQGYIIEYGKGSYEIKTGLIAKILEELPTLMESNAFVSIIKQIGEIDYVNNN